MVSLNNELKQIVKSIKAYIQNEKISGVEDFCLDLPSPPNNTSSLESLRKEIKGCKACSLYKARTNLVFGEGNPKAAVVFVGEAPGREEDLQGRPFVGRAGELLTRIIEAMGLKREDVYICNVLKCRPPENRNPLPEEMLACQDYLRRQLQLIKPKVICTLGKFAAFLLLKEEIPISKIRGKFSEFYGIKVMPTFHPAYLLRNPSAKKLVWQDVQKIMAELKKDVGSRS